jgi:glycosyltransferase involved in cell wall biosynthesis
MKILYAALRHDPRDSDCASGSDYNFYSVFKRAGLEVKIVGPFQEKDSIFERVIKKIYKKTTQKRYPKFSLSLTLAASRALNQIDKAWKPDVIFTIFPPCLTFYRGMTPCVYRLDTSFLGWHQEYPEFGTLALKFLVWQEKIAFRKSTKIITQSLWTKNILIKKYGVSEKKIEVFPNPSAIPKNVVPRTATPKTYKTLSSPLNLLLVGREYRRKGVDIAIEVARQLNDIGIKTYLTVCGIEKDKFLDETASFVNVVGPYVKSDPKQLQQYIVLYEWAHFLIHPARFEAAGITPSEAAAFGVPTITNDSGGLATTVKNDESGVVLPKGSKPDVYVKTILNFIRNPKKYQELSLKTRQRYERELNWEVVSRQVLDILDGVAKKEGSNE